MGGVPQTTVSSPRVVGRESELGRIGHVLGQLQQGRGRVMVIGGEAGIGKTRLIDEAVDQAGDAIRVLRGDCLVLGATIPYLPFAQMLRQLIHDLPQNELVRIIGPARRELARFMPELAIGAPAETLSQASPRMNGEIERLRLYEALLRVGERIVAERPTLFVIEDIQWIDPASLELLAFLTHALAGNEQASLVVSVRSEALEDGASAVLTFLADLERSSAVERIELGSLDAEGTRLQVAAILGQQPTGELATRIHELADGNPLFAEELLAASREKVVQGDALPPKLRDLLAARLARLPDDALAVLRVAAAAGRTLDERLLAAAAGLDDAQVESAVRAAVDEHILVRNSGADQPSYRFRHEIMRALVASQLLPTEAARVHAAYARALSSEPPERQHESEIAFHWDGSGQAEQALPAQARAGRAAADAYAFEQAHEHYERALALWTEVTDPNALVGQPRAWMAERAAAAAGRAGHFERAIELSRAVIDDRDDIDPELFEQARSSLRWYLWDSGEHELGREEARLVIDEPGVSGRWRANALGHFGGLLLSEQRTAEAKDYASEALELARSVDAREEQILAEGVLGWCLVLEGDVEEGIAAMRKALEAARTVDDAAGVGRFPVGLSLAHAQLAAALEMVGWLEQAHEVARAGIGIAAQQGVARTYGSTLRAYAARTLYQLGLWDDAAAETEDALSRGALGVGRVALLTVRALLAVGRGDDASAEAALGEAETLIDASTPADVRRWMAAAVAERELWQGQPMVALTRLAVLEDEDAGSTRGAAARQPTSLDASVPRLLALAARAAADLALQERAAGIGTGLSDAAATQVEATLKRIGRRKTLAQAWQSDLATTRAELARGDPNDSRTPRRWKAAADASDARPYAAAYATWRLAESQLGRRDGRAAAAEIIGTGLGLADSLGATPIADELRDLARRAGLATDRGADGNSVERRGSGRPFGLTTREVEVLALLADGMSNQEIADRLFISPKTASVHVSNIYGKLGVESRVAAATTAASLGITGATAIEDATET